MHENLKKKNNLYDLFIYKACINWYIDIERNLKKKNFWRNCKNCAVLFLREYCFHWDIVFYRQGLIHQKKKKQHQNQQVSKFIIYNLFQFSVYNSFMCHCILHYKIHLKSRMYSTIGKQLGWIHVNKTCEIKWSSRVNMY